MTSRKILVIVCAAALAASSARAQFTHYYQATGSVPIPFSGSGGAAGGISNPANAASFNVNVPIAVSIEHVAITLNLQHSAVGDLRIEISHCGLSAILYNQSPQVAAWLNGVYMFDDAAPTTFASAASAAGAGGTVTPGSYAPANSLAVFDGTNSAGTWTITIYDLVPVHIGAIFQLGVTLSGADTFTSAPTFSFIPDGAGGQCVEPVLRDINVWTHEIISDLTVQVFFSHTWVSDLDITLQHGGVSVALSQYAAPPSSADVNGGYTFWDGAALAWTWQESNASGTTVIPPALYRPKQPLSAFAGLDQFGPWYLIVCDRAGMDVGTLGGFALEISHNLYNLTLSQPSGPASLVLTNYGGVPGHSFVNLFTLAQGSAPAGWILGLDIGINDLIAQVSFGPPFTGTLGSCGLNFTTVGGPIPSGLTIWGASLELDGTMSPVATRSVFSYTTQ